VFPNRVGKPMYADNPYHRGFKPLLKKAGLSGFTFHSLRHTCATLLCSKNVNPKIVQEMWGHANISQTMDTYSHVMPAEERGVQRMRISSPAYPANLRCTPFAPYSVYSIIPAVPSSRLRMRRE
jgi:integrase